MTKSCGREQHQRHHHHHHHHQGQHQCQHHNHHQCQYQRQQQQQQGQCQQQQQRQHQQRHRRPPRPSAAVTLLLALLLSSCGGRAPWSLAAGQSTTSSSSSNVKWTFLVYMLADNNLECFGILDLIVGGGWDASYWLSAWLGPLAVSWLSVGCAPEPSPVPSLVGAMRSSGDWLGAVPYCGHWVGVVPWLPPPDLCRGEDPAQ
ncbi:hypothetical protein PLESTB_001864200, partial [Pleodorina starrii]